MLKYIIKKALPYFKDQLKQMADYLVKEKGYPGSVNTVWEDLKEALEYAMQHGDVK